MSLISVRWLNGAAGSCSRAAPAKHIATFGGAKPEHMILEVSCSSSQSSYGGGDAGKGGGQEGGPTGHGGDSGGGGDDGGGGDGGGGGDPGGDTGDGEGGGDSVVAAPATSCCIALASHPPPDVDERPNIEPKGLMSSPPSNPIAKVAPWRRHGLWYEAVG